MVGIYPSIPHNEGILALKRKFEEQTSKIPTNNLVKLAEFVLKNNFFELNNEIKQRISGTAVGTKFAAPYTCIYFDKTEKDFLKRQDVQPLVWLRYIDDTWTFLFGRMEKQNWKDLWRGSIIFCRTFNLHTSHPKKRVAFLDLRASLENGSITTDLHIKSTNCHQYFHCSFSHPDHIKNSIIYCQTLRLSNTCTYAEDFDKHALNMKSWFLEIGYLKQMIDSQMGKVKLGQRLKTWE